MSTGRNSVRGLAAGAGTVLLLLLALIVFRHTVYEAPAAPVDLARAAAPAAPRQEASAAPEEAVVLSVAGQVQRAGKDGAWGRLNPGERLKAEESIRTGAGGRTDLRIGEKSTLAVTESTQVTIQELTRAVHRFKLDRGRLAVDYKPDGERVLKIESEGAGAVAETRGARFSVLSTGTTLAVATETGAVNLRAAGHEVEVGQGLGAVVRSGDAPTAAAAIAPLPAELLLKVAAAVREENEKLCAQISGVAEPGAEVLIDGTAAQVDREGRFSVAVPRRPREKAEILVAMRDAAGRERSRSVPCDALDPRIHQVDIQWQQEEQ
jgi:hypothetical protein